MTAFLLWERAKSRDKKCLLFFGVFRVVAHGHLSFLMIAGMDYQENFEYNPSSFRRVYD